MTTPIPGRWRPAPAAPALAALFALLHALTAASGQEQGAPVDHEPESEPAPGESALDRALAELEKVPEPLSRDLLSAKAGTATLRLADLSVDLLMAAGTSTEDDESLEALQGGGHDPRARGFTLQNLELSLLGAVDPYFHLETHLIFFIDPVEDESEFELEEAFLTTAQLPWGLEKAGLQAELGYFFTEFGRINPQHPHVWDWLDQPVINTRVFGPDGMRGAGLRAGWLAPLPWFSELHAGVQAAEGDTMASFLSSDDAFDDRPIGGRPFTDREVKSLEDLVYLTRWDNSWDLSDTVTSKLGLSALFGPNATGPDGRTAVWGADLVVKWRPLASDHGWPFVVVQSEVMKRDYHADDFDDGVVSLSSRTLEDWGLYSQVLYGFVRNWAAGVRYEFAGGNGSSVGAFGGRDDDPFRNDRHRLSPLIAWQPTEYSRVRLQYNYDVADTLEGGEAHSFWLGVEVLIGAHPAHSF